VVSYILFNVGCLFKVSLNLCFGNKVPTTSASHLDQHQQFFTSHGFLLHLKSLGVRVAGTVTLTLRSKRTGKCTQKENKAMKKEMPDDMAYTFDNEEILFVEWNDNSVAELGSSKLLK